MARANFIYTIEEVRGNICIVIVDANEGQMSVSDDIKNVVSEIEVEGGIKPKECIVVYQGICGTWEGYDAEHHHFVELGGGHWMHAINKYRKMLRESE